MTLETQETLNRGFDAGYQAGFLDGQARGKAESVQAYKADDEVAHICDGCGAEHFGTDTDARRHGWTLGGGSEWCWTCND